MTTPPDDGPLSTADALARADALVADGRPADARALLATVARADDATSDAPAYLVLAAIARTHVVEGDAVAALQELDAALDAARAAADRAGIAYVRNATAGTLLRLGRIADAERAYADAHREAEAAGDLHTAAKVSANLGVVCGIQGELRAALAHLDAALAAFRRLGLAHDVAYAINNRALALQRLERLEEAAGAYDEALHMLEALGDPHGRAMLHVNRGELAVRRGRLDEARAECDAADAIGRQMGDDRVLALAHKLAGVIARERGDLARAEAELRAAEGLAEPREDLLLLAEALSERADLHQRQGRNRDVFQCLNRAHRLFGQLRARRDVADVDQRMRALEDEFLRVARRWGDAIEAKDRFTQGHCERVAELACAIAARAGADAGFDDATLFWFRIGALLHDVGKLIVPAEVLNKPGKLTDEEWALVRSHPTVGVEMLADTEFPWDVRPIVESHHERWDGRGYPHGLAGEAIPLTARILCIADVYDALTSVRSYKRALGHDETMAILRQDVGAMFDPRVFAWFEEVAPRFAERTDAAIRQATRRDTPSEGAVAEGLDRVTGLPGRAHLLAQGDHVLAARAGRGVAALLAFAVEVAGGAPDAALLRQAAEALSRRTRASDLVTRDAEGRFHVLLADVDAHDAARMAARLAAALADVAGERAGGAARVGAALFPGDGGDADALLRAAERALAAAPPAVPGARG